MRIKFFIFTAVVAIVAVIFLELNTVGSLLNRTSVRATSFLKSIYNAQQQAGEITLLKKQNLLLQNELFELQEIKKENELLRSHLSQGFVKELQLVVASIIGKGFFFGLQTVIINQGFEAGIRQGDAVIVNPSIFIGQVTKVMQKRAYVLLLSSPSFTIPAQTKEGIRGIIEGGLGGQVLLNNVSQGVPLKKGEVLFTTNDNLQIPEGFLIGEITKILSLPTDVVQKASVKVFFNPYLLDTVGVLTSS